MKSGTCTVIRHTLFLLLCLKVDVYKVWERGYSHLAMRALGSSRLEYVDYHCKVVVTSEKFSEFLLLTL